MHKSHDANTSTEGHGRLPTLISKDEPGKIPKRWPHIERFLWVDDSTGGVGEDFPGWLSCDKPKLSPDELAAAYEEWAAFWEWCLVRREPQLAGDRHKRHLVEQWTDSMAHSCRRSAAQARGVDPGEWLPQSQRRPDLYAEGQAIVAEIIAELDAHQGTAMPPSSMSP